MAKYNPQPADTSRVELPRNIENELKEELAENAHENWAKNRINEGWTYGSERNDDEKKHPDLVPYNELSEGEKEYDRTTSLETLKFIYHLGYQIDKKISGKIMVIGNYDSNEQQSLKETANSQSIELELSFYDNWMEAKESLCNDLNQWHAVILDTEGKLDPQGKNEKHMFLPSVCQDMIAIFAKKYNTLPWYILRLKNDVLTNVVVKILTDGNGGKVYGRNHAEEMFRKIRQELPNIRNYRIRCVYQPVFDFLGNQGEVGKDIQNHLIDVLSPLLYPDVFYSFNPEDYGNNLRKVLEGFYRICVDYDIIDEDVAYKNSNEINLAECRRILTYFEPDNKEKGGILRNYNRTLADNLNYMQNTLNDVSHNFGTGLYYTYVSYALQICDLFMWLKNEIRY